MIVILAFKLQILSLVRSLCAYMESREDTSHVLAKFIPQTLDLLYIKHIGAISSLTSAQVVLPISRIVPFSDDPNTQMEI